MREAVLRIAAQFSYCGGPLFISDVLKPRLNVGPAFLIGVRVPDQSLHYLGIPVGSVWSVAYLRAARRWVSSPRGSSHPGDPTSTEPIEPS